MRYFNPRSREGSDNLCRTDDRRFYISIHAPAKGATCVGRLPTIQSANFNPRSREGSDLFLLVSCAVCAVFQSTLPRRERHTAAPSRAAISYFNPRSREGSDVDLIQRVCDSWKFQSTLPRRERLRVRQAAGSRVIISIHAPAKGATVQHIVPLSLIDISIHAPAKGATSAG